MLFLVHECQPCADSFAEKVLPACAISKRIGNIYTGAVFAGVASLVTALGDGLADKRIFMYSYGSGFVCSQYT